MYMVLEMPHEHESHFSNNFTILFHALVVHIGPIRKNYLEWSKIFKYIKQR
jgi:hypothetical protein